MKKTRILILSVSAGAGHVRAAQALEAAAKDPDLHVEAVHVDVLDLVPKLFRDMYGEGYLKMVESQPALWGMLYDEADKHGPDSMLRQFMHSVERLNTGRLAKVVKDHEPDHVIVTHFLPAMLLSRMLFEGAYRRAAWVVVTDFDVHSLWIHQGLAGYFAASDEVKWRMADRGLLARNVHVTGIPIMPQFGEPLDRALCAREIGLDPARRTVLMMSGGAGLGGISKMVERVVALDGDFQVVALSGRNAALLEDLQEMAAAHPGKLHPKPFTPHVERVMAASDLAITKPGGLTTSECLARGLPMIVVSPIPGQEERNADYLLENGAALRASDPAGLEFRVKRLMEDPDRLAEMREKARSLGRPDAARRVLDVVLERS